MSTPTVTVLLAVFNGAPLLRASIGSILAQTFADFELLVVDDGSTDETGKILLEIKDGRLVGKSTNSYPIIYLERASGTEDLDLLHSIEVRMRLLPLRIIPNAALKA